MKKKIKWVALGSTVCLLLFLVYGFISSFRYPQIVRSAYWRYPFMMYKDALITLFPGKGIDKQTAINIASNYIPNQSKLDANVLYLPKYPKNDKSIQDRYFGLLSKGGINTNQELFWVITASDITVILEYNTGKYITHDAD